MTVYKKTLQGALIASIFACVIVLFIQAGGKKTSPPTEVKTGELWQPPPNGPLANSGGEVAKNGAGPPAEERELRMSIATAALLEICNKIEKENSNAYFQKHFPGRNITCISITPPTADQIGQISKIISLQMGGAPISDDMHRELHQRLMAIYNEHVIFKKAFRVLYLEQSDDGAGVRLTEAEYDSLKSAVPSESGAITMNGAVRVYDLTKDAWKMRYGHVVSINTRPDER